MVGLDVEKLSAERAALVAARDAAGGTDERGAERELTVERIRVVDEMIRLAELFAREPCDSGAAESLRST